MSNPHPLVEEFRRHAAYNDVYGSLDAARIWRKAAEAVDIYFSQTDLEVLTLQEASTASGFSVSQLSRLVEQGQLDNAGRKGAPRLRRGDLPRKPAKRPHHTGEPDLVGRVHQRDDPHDG